MLKMHHSCKLVQALHKPFKMVDMMKTFLWWLTCKRTISDQSLFEYEALFQNKKCRKYVENLYFFLDLKHVILSHAKFTPLFYHDQKISLTISTNLDWKFWHLHPPWTKTNPLSWLRKMNLQWSKKYSIGM